MIGIFDSGIGGLTVVKELKRLVPSRSILYFGDTARVPWGNKSPDIVRKYCEEICKFLVSKNVSEIVIACNTASAVASKHLEYKFQNVEFHNVIDPCIKAVEGEKFERVGVIGTRATIASGVYERKIKEIDRTKKVYCQECSLFVPLAEEGWAKEKISLEIAKKYFKFLKKKKLDALILGCTHYPLLDKVIREAIGKDVKIISSAKEVSKRIDNSHIGKKEESRDYFYFSDIDEHSKKVANKILNKRFIMKKVVLK